ncbi:Innexin family-containing protein [Strongyloides ratti]|uniref:Innexin n=1 Tax=Strongyloides ratti TaxID=34506 RepID=A0A090MRP5_STRRB|nr:Innexin family-containing protein [Strongyloides ratti]CEF60913.1 Innexin family-containing protein [Strongyloides ratti]
MVLTTVLSMIRYVSEIDDRDFVDRLHGFFTTNILIGLAVLVSFKQFGGKPIECLVPDIFTSSWEQYAENYCWSQDNYYVPLKESAAGMEESEKKARKISYYQWVPFFLLISAVFFRLPSLLWKYLAGQSGIKINELVKMACDDNNIKPDIKKANIKSLVIHLQGALKFHKRVKKKQIKQFKVLFLCNLPYSSAYVTLMYVFSKFLYLANVTLQLFLMNSFLETDRYKYYGLEAVLDLIKGKTWDQTGMFPRVSLCDFDVRVMGNIQEHTIQCVLVINIFNEKIFIFLWFWYLTLLIFTLGSFLYWVFINFFPSTSKRFIARHLEMSELMFDPKENDKDLDKFVYGYLKYDGVFVIRQLTMHSGIIFGTEVVANLWKSYYNLERELKRSNSYNNCVTTSNSPQNNNNDQDNDSNEMILRNRKDIPLNINFLKNQPLNVPLKQSLTDEKDCLIPPPLPPSDVINALKKATGLRNPSLGSQETTSPMCERYLTEEDKMLNHKKVHFLETPKRTRINGSESPPSTYYSFALDDNSTSFSNVPPEVKKTDPPLQNLSNVKIQILNNI